MARAIGRDDLATDVSLATNRDRLAHRERVVAELGRTLRQRSAGEWLQRLEAVGVPSGVVKDVLEAIGEARTASPLSGMPSSIGGEARIPPPRLDEHGELIRRSGWGAFSGYR